jgi:hypothetical protein
MYQERGQVWDEYEQIVTFLKEQGFVGFNNGLTEDENRELATTRSINRIIELIFLGLIRKL